ncbi:hypothetical protein CG404_00080 [Bifidobacteriaceae bacterium VN003]|nr:hypothetical protein CG404_00080 [Bifidobacteriaceae bacterium VN003]
MTCLSAAQRVGGRNCTQPHSFGRNPTGKRQKLHTAAQFWSESDWEAAETAHGCKVLAGIRLANGRNFTQLHSFLPFFVTGADERLRT